MTTDLTRTAYTIEEYDNEREWLKARLQGVGASEASALARLSRFCGEFALYRRKIEGRVEDDDENAHLAEMSDAGHRHEPTVADWFCEQPEFASYAMVDPGEYTVYRSRERPHVYFTPDRVLSISLSRGLKAPWECKCAWFDAAKEWKDRVPVGYQCQLQQAMYVMGASEGYFAVLLNGYQFRWFRMERHDRWIEKQNARIDQFWDRVQRRDPPRACGHKSSLYELFRSHPQDDGRVIELPDDCRSLGEQWDEAAHAEKHAKAAKDKIKARVEQLAGDAKYAALPDGTGFAWSRNGERQRFTRKDKVPHHG